MRQWSIVIKKGGFMRCTQCDEIITYFEYEIRGITNKGRVNLDRQGDIQYLEVGECTDERTLYFCPDCGTEYEENEALNMLRSLKK
jgi:hypothetical protein